MLMGNVMGMAFVRARKKPLPPDRYVTEQLTAAVTDLDIVVTQVYYTDSYAEEQLTAAITDLSIVVTQTGANPL